MSSKFDLELVKQQVSTKSVEEARDFFLEEIMDWTDTYTEHFKEIEESAEAKVALKSLVDLWIEYCNMEKSKNQFKKCETIVEKALQDPVVSKCAGIYIAFAEYYKQRGKETKEQKLYIKGLSSGLPRSEADELWVSYLNTLLEKDPSLTVQKLYDALKSEEKLGDDIRQNLTAPSSKITGESQAESKADSMIVDEPYSRAESKDDDVSNADNVATEQMIKVSSEAVAAEEENLMALDNDHSTY